MFIDPALLNYALNTKQEQEASLIDLVARIDNVSEVGIQGRAFCERCSHDFGKKVSQALVSAFFRSFLTTPPLFLSLSLSHTHTHSTLSLSCFGFSSNALREDSHDGVLMDHHAFGRFRSSAYHNQNPTRSSK